MYQICYFMYVGVMEMDDKKGHTTSQIGKACERSTVPSPKTGVCNTDGRRRSQIHGSDEAFGFSG